MSYDKVEDKELYWKALEAEYLSVAAERSEERRKKRELALVKKAREARSKAAVKGARKRVKLAELQRQIRILKRPAQLNSNSKARKLKR